MLGVMAQERVHPSSPRRGSAAIPYRDVNGSSIRYYTPEERSNPLQNINAYDSDMEPLVDSSVEPEEIDFERFTATGRPMPGYVHSGFVDMYSVPNYLPRRYTDESIIPAIVVDVIPSPVAEVVGEVVPKEKTRRLSFLSKFKAEKVKPAVMTKVVFMPRGEYLKFFARGQSGEYVGTEPYKQWTEKELDERYGRFRPVFKREKKGWIQHVLSPASSDFRTHTT